MRQPILTNHHSRTRPSLPSHHTTTLSLSLDNLLPRLLRNPMIISSEVEEHPRSFHLVVCISSGGRRGYPPNIITPFIRRNGAHFISGHVSFPFHLSVNFLFQSGKRGRGKVTYKACLTPLLLFKKAQVVSTAWDGGSAMNSLISARRAKSGRRVVRMRAKMETISARWGMSDKRVYIIFSCW